jgi:uncharacterized damage-inducible protein DinB
MAEIPTIRVILIGEIAAEEGATRRTLERIPQERWDWAPHEKSMKMGRLAGWVARSLGGVKHVLEHDTWDMASDDGGLPPEPKSAAELVPTFDIAVRSARQALEAAPDSLLAESWTMRQGDQVLWGPVPKYVVVRSFFMGDLIHHRAQLGVYLRLLGLPVPAVYGPSADEMA